MQKSSEDQESPLQEFAPGSMMTRPPGIWKVRWMYVRGLARWIGSGLSRNSSRLAVCGYDIDLLGHTYNFTWMNERAVEVPLGLKILTDSKESSILEIGNVLRHYRDGLRHKVVDKYESGAGVIKADASEYDPSEKFNLIISLSTLEHVGWDELPRDPNKAAATVMHLCTLLVPDGTLFFTVPAGYHPALDHWLLSEPEKLRKLIGIRRCAISPGWEECEASLLAGMKFGDPYPFGNGIFAAWFGPA